MRNQILVFTALLAVSGSPFIPTNYLGQFAAIAKSENKGGQVIESQGYHLEFVPEKTAKGMHLDFYLQKSDTHAAIANAKITAQVQLPDGKKQTLPLTYDAKEKHYTAILETKATGDFKVAMLCDINGKKVNGRFSFKR
jgi:hypothetical protein